MINENIEQSLIDDFTSLLVTTGVVVVAGTFRPVSNYPCVFIDVAECREELTGTSIYDCEVLITPAHFIRHDQDGAELRELTTNIRNILQAGNIEEASKLYEQLNDTSETLTYWPGYIDQSTPIRDDEVSAREIPYMITVQPKSTQE